MGSAKNKTIQMADCEFKATSHNRRFRKDTLGDLNADSRETTRPTT